MYRIIYLIFQQSPNPANSTSSDLVKQHTSPNVGNSLNLWQNNTTAYISTTPIRSAQNASDSGLSGTEDINFCSNSDLSEPKVPLRSPKTHTPTVLLNRPATLDLKPSFINTSKQSEGISLSPASVNEDEAFLLDERIEMINQSLNNAAHLEIQSSPASCIRTQYKVSSPSIIKRKRTENANKELLQISSSLSLSSSMTSSSVPSSISPLTTSSPRSFHLQSQATSSNTLQSNQSRSSQEPMNAATSSKQVKNINQPTCK